MAGQGRIVGRVARRDQTAVADDDIVAVAGLDQRILDLGHGADRLDRDVLHDMRLAGDDETVTLAVGRLETLDHGVARGEIDDQRAVGAVVTQMDLLQQADLVVAGALVRHVAEGVRREGVEQA